MSILATSYKGLQAGQIIASLTSEGGMVSFRNRYQLLQDLISYWKLGTEVVLTPLKCPKALEQAIPEVPEPVVVNSDIAEDDHNESTDQVVLENLENGPDIPEEVNTGTKKQACAKLSLNVRSEKTQDSINAPDTSEEMNMEISEQSVNREVCPKISVTLQKIRKVGQKSKKT